MPVIVGQFDMVTSEAMTSRLKEINENCKDSAEFEMGSDCKRNKFMWTPTGL